MSRRRVVTTCRGFGERQGSCKNLPGIRTINDGRGPAGVPSLCETCDRLRLQTGADIAGAEGRLQRQETGRITGMDFTHLDSGNRITARRSRRL
jgi:hypothetical protein